MGDALTGVLDAGAAGDAAFAELERDIIHERTMAGLAAAKAQGRIGTVRP
ncbi:MAG: recombinase family protein [Acidobacteriaceae bacterium]